MNENKRELRKFFGIELLTEVQDEHEKKIIALFGKYFITFRTRVPYECFIGRRDDEENSFKLCAGYTQALDIKKLMFIDIYRRLNNVFDIRVRIVKELMRKGERKKKDNYL